jgi:hypothetical protein
MRYIDVTWKHEEADEPVRLVSEIGLDEYETRKLEFFIDGTVGFASSSSHSSDTRLGEDVVPSIADINDDAEFEGVEITKIKFEELWIAYAPSNS